MPNTYSADKRNVVFLVIVAALGYFVDIYDLVVFSIVRLRSFQDIGILPGEAMRQQGVYVINMQMLGLLAGGILWGIVGDKFGRIKVLFGSILLYSIANFANGLVNDINTYAVVRLIAGVGLAGELGAGITLVSETLSKEKRGYGTMVVAVVGLLGAVAANMVGKYDWRTAYYVGGGLGFILLLFRVGTFESGMYKATTGLKVQRGNIMMLFTSFNRFKKYLYCILIGAPLWYVVGILITQSPEFGVALHAKDVLNAGNGIMYTYIGIAIGDVFAGLLAQATRSRKITMLVFLISSLGAVAAYLNAFGITSHQFIWLCFFMGISVGYWATFVTIASEQFGTNIRATVTTTVPNFVRGALIPINFGFNILAKHYEMIYSGYIMMIALTVISLLSLSQLKESFGKDLDYMESDELQQA